MSTKPVIPVEEYLRMNLDGPAPEYVDGELVERNVGELPHSETQGRLYDAFRELRQRGLLFVYMELHLRIGSNYSVADLAGFTEKPAGDIPSEPPLLTIEITSPNDRINCILDKCEAYLRWGVPHVWLVNPHGRRFSVYDENGLRDVPRLDLPEFNLAITPD